MISLIVPRKKSLNKKAHEVNKQLINMCDKKYITFFDHTDRIDYEKHLNESKVHLDKSGTIEFAKNFCEFLMQQDWYSADNCGNIALGNEKVLPVLAVSTKYLSITFITRLLLLLLLFQIKWKEEFSKSYLQK